MDDTTVRIPKKYQILEEIGRGSISIVYKALEPRQKRLVAVKVLPPQFTFDTDFVRRFLEAGKAASTLHHPNIVEIYEVGEREDLYYVVMQYVDGGSLARLLGQTAPAGEIPLQRAITIVEQVAAALDYAHQQSFFHHYLTPRDILLDSEDHVTVTDFGLKRTAVSTALVRGGFAIGTPEYMAPEQIRGRPADHRADIYALGAICYTMLAGRAPFEGDPPAVLHAQVYERPVPLRALNPALPLAVERVVEVALAKEPEQRYSSGAEFVRALKVAVEQREIAEPTRGRRAGAAPTPRPSAMLFSQPWVLVAILVAAVEGLCLAALVWAVLLFGGRMRLVSLGQVLASPTAIRVPTFVLQPPATSTVTPTPSPTTPVPPVQAIPTNTPSPTDTPTSIPTRTPALTVPGPQVQATATRTPTPRLTEPPAGTSTFTNLALARGIDANGEPVSPGTTFSPGGEPVYAFFEYHGMRAGIHWAHVWYRDSTELDRAEGLWPEEWGDRGVAWVFYAPAGGFTPGRYEVRLWVAGEVVARAAFTIR
jgi:hypothetical protein